MQEYSGRSRYAKVKQHLVITLFVVPWPHEHCHPLATSERRTHPLECPSQGHLLLLSLLLSFFSLSCFLLHLSTSLLHHRRPLAETHTYMMRTKPNTASFSCLGKDTDELTHPQLSCHLCHLGPCVCLCARLCCVRASPWDGSALWEVTVSVHKLGCMGRGTGLDLIIISETERT